MPTEELWSFEAAAQDFLRDSKWTVDNQFRFPVESHPSRWAKQSAEQQARRGWVNDPFFFLKTPPPPPLITTREMRSAESGLSEGEDDEDAEEGERESEGGKKK